MGDQPTDEMALFGSPRETGTDPCDPTPTPKSRDPITGRMSHRWLIRPPYYLLCVLYLLRLYIVSYPRPQDRRWRPDLNRSAITPVRLLGSALMTAALAGCNTVMRGTEETVTITTRPASARIWTSLGQGCPQSPCTVRVARKTEFTAHAAARGYQPGSLVVSSKLTSQAAPGVVGNAIIPGGSVGLVVDVATGAMLDHTPNPAHIDLVPIKRARRARKTYRGAEQIGTIGERLGYGFN
jgi:hypothetical protein